MRVELMTVDGGIYQMPPPLEYRVSLTGSIPCDSMEVTAAYDGTLAEVLPYANRFAAYEGSRLLLTGVVDEYEITADPRGNLLTVCGRGLLALLLDNEAEAAHYQQATVAELVKNHVEPYGISARIDRRLQAGGGYQVASGSSQWKAVSEFTQYTGGFDPHMTAAGLLVVGPRTGSGRQIELKGRPILSCRYRDRRYGVISEVLVKDKSRGVSRLVVDQELKKRGARVRRVVYTPGKSTWAAMRYTGEYQIRRAREGMTEIEVVLSGTVDICPGDVAALPYPSLGINGRWDVAAVEQRLDENGLQTAVTLWEM